MKKLKAVEILTNYIKNLNEMVVSLEEAPTVRILEYEAEQALAELQAYKAKFEELEAKYNQLTHKHDLVCHENCQNLCWENEESYCKEEGCIRNYIDPSLYIDIHKDKYKPRELDK